LLQCILTARFLIKAVSNLIQFLEMFALDDLGFGLVAGIVTLFVILDPIGVVPFFQVLTRGASEQQRAKIANRAALIALVLLLVFAYLGDFLLVLLGVTLADFEIAGGSLLFIFAVRDALSNEPLGASETTAAIESASMLQTIAVIPIATPLLAGPGSLTTVILLGRESYGFIIAGVAIAVDCALAWLAMRTSSRLTRLIGPSGLMIIGKVMDILMAAIAVSYLIKGLSAAGL
jgi:multiple antibiotic resistance protein